MNCSDPRLQFWRYKSPTWSNLQSYSPIEPHCWRTPFLMFDSSETHSGKLKSGKVQVQRWSLAWRSLRVDPFTPPCSNSVNSTGRAAIILISAESRCLAIVASDHWSDPIAVTHSLDTEFIVTEVYYHWSQRKSNDRCSQIAASWDSRFGGKN